MSVAGKRQSTIGPGHDGGPKSGFYAKPGKPGLDVHHDPMDARRGDHGVKGNLARDGAAKRLDPVAPHSGMNPRQTAGAGLGGLSHASAVLSGGQVVATNAAAVPAVPASRRGFNSADASQVSAPITHAYGKGVPKVREAAPIKSGMRSRTGPLAKSLTDATPHAILGKLLLDEAKR